MYKLMIFTIILSYCMYHIFSGERGVLSMMDTEQKIAEKQQILKQLIAEREVLESKIAGLKGPKYDHDLIDELIRQKFGMADPNEKVIIIK